jgi:hypothetical protein
VSILGFDEGKKMTLTTMVLLVKLERDDITRSGIEIGGLESQRVVETHHYFGIGAIRRRR